MALLAPDKLVLEPTKEDADPKRRGDGHYCVFAQCIRRQLPDLGEDTLIYVDELEIIIGDAYYPMTKRAIDDVIAPFDQAEDDRIKLDRQYTFERKKKLNAHEQYRIDGEKAVWAERER